MIPLIKLEDVITKKRGGINMKTILVKSAGCSQCRLWEKIMIDKGIDFKVVDAVDVLERLITKVPVIIHNNKLYDLGDFITHVRNGSN
jgi:glutaredoxin